MVTNFFTDPIVLIALGLLFVLSIIGAVLLIRNRMRNQRGRIQTTIKWDPQRMATGVPEVDAQHQEWIRRYNEFDEAVSRGKGIEVVRSTLDFFVGYANTHFKLEEACMAERNCPAAEANRAAHQQIRIILAGYQASVERKEVSMVEVATLRIQMQKWLVNHILTIDIQLRDC